MAKNRKEEPVKARVVGLWGDPGLTEYYNYDVLSRFCLSKWLLIMRYLLQMTLQLLLN